MLRLPSRCLVVLIGVAGSGKSTWAAANFRPEQVVSTDALRAVVGESPADQRASRDAFDVLDRIVAARMKRRLLTVIDSTALKAKARKAWVAAAHERGLPAIAVVITTPPAQARTRNLTRRHAVPDAAVSRHLRAVAGLTPEVLTAEGFDRVVAVDPTTAEPVRIVPPAFTDADHLASRQREEPVTMRFGLQIPRFDPPPADLRGHLRDVAAAAEEAGFSSVWVMDHVIQIPQVGREWEDILEAYTTLGFLAAVTERVSLGTLVTGITYRNLALLAKQVATLDVLSGGRAVAGLGAAWYEREHTAYGWAFPDLGERYALLRDALELLPLMWGPGTPAFEGRTTTVAEAICYPRPIQAHIPILVGGSGERTTLRLVAEHADACNLVGDVDTVRRKVEVLRGHCADVGRDPAEVEVTTLGVILAAPDEDSLAARVAALTPADRAPEAIAEQLGAGTVEEHIGRFRAYADVGVDQAIISLPILHPGRVAELAPLVAAFA